MSEFDADKADLVRDLEQSRAVLVAIVGNLVSRDFEQARRGSWSIARILEHVLHSERLYTQLISAFSGKSANVQVASPLASAGEAVPALESSRKAFLDAVGQVREDDFYRLQTVGHEEYSVLSILENNAIHDREHSEQLRKTLESA